MMVQTNGAHAERTAEAKRRLRDVLSDERVRDGDSKRDLHGADFSFHEPHSAIGGEGFKSLAEGAKVEYEVEDGPKGPQARSVNVIASV